MLGAYIPYSEIPRKYGRKKDIEYKMEKIQIFPVSQTLFELSQSNDNDDFTKKLASVMYDTIINLDCTRIIRALKDDFISSSSSELC